MRAHVTPSTAAASARRAVSLVGLGSTGCRGARGGIQSHGGGGGWRRAESNIAFDGAAKFDEIGVARYGREDQHGRGRAVHGDTACGEIGEHGEGDGEGLMAAFAQMCEHSRRRAGAQGCDASFQLGR